MKIVKSRSGVLSVMVAILCGLMLGLIACHLYNLKKVEAFSQNDEKTYEFDINFDDSDKQALKDLHKKMTTTTHDNNKKNHKTDTKTTTAQTNKMANMSANTSANTSVMNNDSMTESPGTQVQMDANSLNDFYSQLPQGVPRSQIPEGDEDLYILKSEIVPPVCPACPTFNCPREKPCPPCPACERCPEPAFECKKVPNYNVSNVNEYLPSASNFFGMSEVSNKQPRPVLNDFSQFN